MAEDPVELVDIFWEETSGVDVAANEEKGWLVMKAKTAGQAEDLGNDLLSEVMQILNEGDEMSKNLHQLASLLSSLDTDKLPSNVKGAVATLLRFVHEDDDDEEDDSGHDKDKTKKSDDEPGEGSEEETNESEEEITDTTERASLKSKIAQALASLVAKVDGDGKGPKRIKRVNKAEELFPGLMVQFDEVDASKNSDEAKRVVKTALFQEFKEAVLAEEAEDEA